LELAARKSGCIAAVVVVDCYLYVEEDGDVLDLEIRGRETERRGEDGLTV
jgi:hypothetical protein